MKYFIVILAVIALVAAVTNPDPLEHKEILKFQLKQQMKQSMANHNGSFWEEAGEFFGNLVGGAAVDLGVDQMITIENYTLFSVSMITWNGATERVAIGAFGQVFLINDLHNIIRGGSRNNQLEPIE